MGIKKNLMADLNKAKYANAPTWDEIKDFLDEIGMTMAHFEKFHGLTELHLAHVKMGQRKLVTKCWHIIFERIKPMYGAGFIEEITTNKAKNRIKANMSNEMSITCSTTDTSHDRLGNIK